MQETAVTEDFLSQKRHIDPSWHRSPDLIGVVPTLVEVPCTIEVLQHNVTALFSDWHAQKKSSNPVA